MKLALLFFGLIAAYLLIGWLIVGFFQFNYDPIHCPVRRSKRWSDWRSSPICTARSTVRIKSGCWINCGNPGAISPILMPGDIIDDIKPLRGAELFLDQAAAIAPCYYCTGNHENIDTLDHAPGGQSTGASGGSYRFGQQERNHHDPRNTIYVVRN